METDRMQQNLTPNYVGRFAPSPTGPLHAGSLVAAMASYLDAKAQQGQWLVRIEDIDEARSAPEAADAILRTLSALGMQWDDAVIKQSARKHRYEAALAKLQVHTFGCGCTRREISDSRIAIAAGGAAVYPGTCRNGLEEGKIARAIRLRVPPLGAGEEHIVFEDRLVGLVSQRLASEVGDFILKRADGMWAYQLAVVVDDAEQGVTDIVRGTDLLDSTARQIFLQRLLQLPTPRYLHVPVVTNALGEKLSKQTGALAVDHAQPVQQLITAAQFLGLSSMHAQSVADFWQSAIPAWANKWGIQA